MVQEIDGEKLIEETAASITDSRSKSLQDIENYVEKAVYSKKEEYLIAEDKFFQTMVNEYHLRKGKYLRAKLMWLVGKLYGADDNEILLPATAIQVAEDAVLIADDIQDMALTRRDGPSLNSIYGNSNAMNASLYLEAKVWEILTDYINAVGKEKGIRMFKEFQEASKDTVIGQTTEKNFRDLETLDEETCYRIARNKTSRYTVVCPVISGAIAADQDKKTLDILMEISEPIGIAFQIYDDIRDVKEDIISGHPTLIIQNAYTSAKKDEKEKLREIYFKNPMQKTKEEIEYVEQTIAKYDSVEVTRKKMLRYFNSGLVLYGNNNANIPENDYKYMILELFKEFISN